MNSSDFRLQLVNSDKKKSKNENEESPFERYGATEGLDMSSKRGSDKMSESRSGTGKMEGKMDYGKFNKTQFVARKEKTSKSPLKIKTQVNQTYLYDLAKFQRKNREQMIEAARSSSIQEKPIIDENSARMARESRVQGQEEVHVRLHKQAEETRRLRKEAIDEEKSQETRKLLPDEVKDFIDRNQVQVADQKRALIKTDKMKKEQELQTMFKPNLCAESKKLAQQRVTSLPTFEELYRGAASIRQKREAQQKQLEEKRREAEMEGVTFKPKTTKSKPKAVVSGEPSYNLKNLTSQQYIEICRELDQQANNPQLSLLGKNADLYAELLAPLKGQAVQATPSGYATLAAVRSNPVSGSAHQSANNTSPRKIGTLDPHQTHQRSSYLSMHLNKKNAHFNKLRNDQESKMMQLSKVSKDLLKELQKQRQSFQQSAMEEDPSLADFKVQLTDEGPEEQFNIIETFLKTLTLDSKQQTGNLQMITNEDAEEDGARMIDFNGRQDVELIQDFNRRTRINFSDQKEGQDEGGQGNQLDISPIRSGLQNVTQTNSNENSRQQLIRNDSQGEANQEGRRPTIVAPINRSIMQEAEAALLEFDQCQNVKVDESFASSSMPKSEHASIRHERGGSSGLQLANQNTEIKLVQPLIGSGSRKLLAASNQGSQLLNLQTPDASKQLNPHDNPSARESAQYSAAGGQYAGLSNVLQSNASMKSPETDLRREVRYGDHDQTLRTPEQMRPVQTAAEAHQQTGQTLKAGTNQNIAVLSMESPSPHKPDQFQNRGPDLKSKSSKKFESNQALDLDISQNHLQKGFDELNEYSQRQENEDFSKVVESEIQMAPQLSFGRFSQHFDIKTHQINLEGQGNFISNEIQIEENTVEGDSSDYRKTPQYDENGTQYQSYGEGKFIQIDLQDHQSSFQIAEASFKEEPAQQVLSQDSNPFFNGESYEHNQPSKDNGGGPEMESDARYNTSQVSSVDKRANQSLSLIEEAENEDSLSYTQGISLKGGNQGQRFNKTGNIDFQSLNEASPIQGSRATPPDLDSISVQLGNQRSSVPQQPVDGQAFAAQHYHSNSTDHELLDPEQDPTCPQLCKDVVSMEKSFIAFLSSIYD